MIEAKAQEMQMQAKIMMESMLEGRSKAEQAAHRQKIESKLASPTVARNMHDCSSSAPLIQRHPTLISKS